LTNRVTSPSKLGPSASVRSGAGQAIPRASWQEWRTDRGARKWTAQSTSQWLNCSLKTAAYSLCSAIEGQWSGLRSRFEKMLPDSPEPGGILLSLGITGRAAVSARECACILSPLYRCKLQHLNPFLFRLPGVSTVLQNLVVSITLDFRAAYGGLRHAA
jgi:hypothetical protein